MMRRICGTSVVLLAVTLLGGCAPGEVSFRADVQPILKQYCLECHVPGGAGYNASGFDMSSHASLMKGGKFGPFVIPGDPLSSTLNMLVEGRADPSIRMPHGRAQLKEHEIAVLRAWVQEGARDN